MKLNKEQIKAVQERRNIHNEKVLGSIFPNRIVRRTFQKKMNKIVYMDAYYFEIEQVSGQGIVFQYNVTVFLRDKSNKKTLGTYKMIDEAKKAVIQYNQKYRFQLEGW